MVIASVKMTATVKLASRAFLSLPPMPVLSLAPNSSPMSGVSP